MYASKFGPVMEEMLTIRHRSGLQLKFIGFFLDDFDAFCAREYPEATLLTKEIAETWTAPILHPGTTWRGGA